MKVLMLPIFFLLLSGTVFAQKTDCSVMRSGTFKYLESDDSTAYIVITDTSHTEFYSEGKYYIKSQMRWISDCQYSMKMLENTIPDFPFKPGDVMLVTIKKVEEEIIFYTSEVKGLKWDTKIKKIK